MVKKDKKFDKALKTVIGSLLQQCEEERKKDPKYKKLFKESTTYGSLLRNLNHNISCNVLDSCEVLRNKFGVKEINNETFDFLLALPILESTIQKKINNDEGRSCCVDKTYYVLSAILKTKLEAKE